MIQTPRENQGQSDLGLYLALALLWIVPGLLFSLAAILAGGQPHTRVVDWPYFAIRDLVHNHNGVLPWQWVGADTVRSSIVFYAVIVVVTVPLLTAILVLLVVLRGGIPAFFPFLSQPHVRSRWAARGALGRAGLLLSAPDGRRLVLGRHLDAWVGVREGVSVLALGAPGTGKSSGLCIPAIGEWQGAVVAVSDRTDLVEMTAGIRQHLGQVDVLDAGGYSGLATCTWSSAGVHLSFDEAVALIEGVVGSRMPEPDEPTRHLLTCALYAAANRGVGVGGAVEWLDDMTGATLVRALLLVPDRDPRATSWVARIVERSRDERAASFSAARQLLRAHFEQAAPAAGTHAFQPSAFLTGAANTLYVLTAGDGPSGTGPVESLLRTLIAEAATHHPRRRRGLLVVLDGCAAAAAMPDLGERLASRDNAAVTVLAVARDLDDCAAQVEWNMAGLADRARVVLLLGGIDDAPPAELMHRLVRRQLTPRGRRRARHDDWRPDLLPPEAARYLGPGRALLVHDRLAPALLWLRNCYEDPDLLARQREHPFVRGVTHIDRAS